MNTTTGTIAERVRRGALLLDVHCVGWARKINEQDLDIHSCSRCVLGQVYESFSTGSKALDLWDDDLEKDFGFGSLSESYEEAEAEFSALAAAWLVEIRARLAPEPDAAIGAWNCPAHAELVP